MTLADENRTLAMVATEAALVHEQNPARYARLQRRNALAANLPVGPAASLGDVASDAVWLEDVLTGRWRPNATCSNCLGYGKLEGVVLYVTASPVARYVARYHAEEEILRMRLPADGGLLTCEVDERRLQAIGWHPGAVLRFTFYPLGGDVAHIEIITDGQPACYGAARREVPSQPPAIHAIRSRLAICAGTEEPFVAAAEDGVG